MSVDELLKFYTMEKYSKITEANLHKTNMDLIRVKVNDKYNHLSIEQRNDITQFLSEGNNENFAIDSKSAYFMAPNTDNLYLYVENSHKNEKKTNLKEVEVQTDSINNNCAVFHF